MAGTVIGDLDFLVENFKSLQSTMDEMNKTMGGVYKGIDSLNEKPYPEPLAQPVTVLSKTVTRTFTFASLDVTHNLIDNPMSSFSLQVRATGAVTAWNVILEGSLDGVIFTQILQHTQANLTGTTLFTGNTKYPCNYIRMKCVSITLGGGTNVIATALGIR